ncbi:MAG: ABC transporter permease subunit [Lachnospiraceae bacterium]|nr:ABC transporter permease subunit [Lachnospiraceae bacterium]
MGTLLKFEIKKIVMKKSTIVAFVLLFGIQVFLSMTGSLGSTYKNDMFVETHAERNRIDREHGIALSGRAIDDVLLSEMQEAYAGFDWNNPDYWWTDEYNQGVRRYTDLEYRLKLWGMGTGYSFDNMEAEVLYDLRRNQRDSMWEAYELSDKEKTYWQEKDAEVEIPFVYEYASGYDSLTGMQGMYMTCMLMTFFIGISMVTVFAEEHTRKTDQLILCARYGKSKAYFAKILAGSLVVFGGNMLFAGVLIVGRFFSFGTEGFGAAIQSVVAPWYSYPLTMGQALLLMTGILLLSGVLVAVFAMLLAEVLGNSVGAMAVVVGLLFAARLVPIPPSFGVLSQAWNYMPINMLKVDEGFLDPRLVNLFGLQLTTWQFAPILYVVLIGGMVFAGSRFYRRYQVSGR